MRPLEGTLLQKLRKIEALHAGTSVDGEREAARRAAERMVVIRFANPRGIEFPSLLQMIGDSLLSRANTIVVPGRRMELAMQLIFTPFISRRMERRRRALHE